MTSGIETQFENGVVTLKFNRPDKKNAITAEMYSALAEGLNYATNNDDARLVKIIGSDTAFCAGNDLADFLENPPESDDASVWQFLFALARCTKPIIAGVNGPAVGVGTTLLLHCDLVVASESSVFALPFTALGLCPEAASSLLMPLQVGAKKANEWLLLGDRFNSIDAQSAGLINYSVATAEEVNQQLNKWESRILKLPVDSVATTRSLLKKQWLQETQKRLSEEGDEFKRLLKSDAAQSAFAAFLKK